MSLEQDFGTRQLHELTPSAPKTRKRGNFISPFSCHCGVPLSKGGLHYSVKLLTRSRNRSCSYSPEPMMSSAKHWMYAASTITDSNLDNETWQKWYQEVHIPDILNTGSVDRALLYRAASDDNPKQWLAVYDCYDLDFMQPDRFKNIPQKHAYLGQGKTSMDVADFDVRQFDLLSDFDPMMSGSSAYYTNDPFPRFLFSNVAKVHCQLCLLLVSYPVKKEAENRLSSDHRLPSLLRCSLDSLSIGEADGTSYATPTKVPLLT